MCKKDDVQKAHKGIEDMVKLSNKYRKTGFIIGLMKMIKTPNYDKYTDCEYDLFYQLPV